MRPRGLLLDLDGTLYEGAVPIAGAVAAVGRLRAAGIPVRFVTNTTRFPRTGLLAQLRALGFEVALEELITAPVAAASWLRAHGIRRVGLCVPAATVVDFADFEHDDVRPEAVVVGDLGREWTFDRLNSAFRWLMEGARLVAMQKNRYWKTPEGLALDVGAFVAALEYGAGVEATVVGKPSPAFFVAAAATMGLATHSVAAVGDDAVSDVAGGQSAGCFGVLVQTGKYRPGDESAGERPPDAVLPSVAALPALLGLSS
jgi:HAD superfamily hydrolase (TIGR01458 family)